MPITHKTKAKQSLFQNRVWITDTDPNSRYFQITQMPGVLTAGKNAFLINGSPELLDNSEVLLELLDSAGNAVFCHPIKKYVEGLARLVSIEVYADTAEGMGTLTILGRITRDANGNPVPVEFQSAYNVKWQRRISIAPRIGNSQPIRLLHHPSASVTEVLNPFRLSTQTVLQGTASAGTTLHGISDVPFVQTGNPLDPTYAVVTSTPFFIKQMESGDLYTTIPGVGPFTSSISRVVNSTTAVLTTAPTSASTFSNFIATDFTASYSGAVQYVPSEYVKSYANLRVKRLSTFSGDIYKIKVYVNSIESPSDPRPIADVPLSAPELLITSSLSTAALDVRTGYFTDDPTTKKYWFAAAMVSMSLYNPDK